MKTTEQEREASAAPPGKARRRFSRWRRRLDQIKLDRDAGAEVDVSLEHKLELMLLREENVRLKSERHRPFDVGAMIEQLRLRAVELDRARTIDEAWSALCQYLLLHENLAQASREAVLCVRATWGRALLLVHGQSLAELDAALAPLRGCIGRTHERIADQTA